MADGVTPSGLPLKQEIDKKSNETKKWNNTTKTKTIGNNNPSNMLKVTKTKIPFILKSLSPESDMDSFFQKRKPPEGRASYNNDSLNNTNQIQMPLQSDSIPFGHVTNTTNISPNYPKRDRNYPKPWLVKPNRVNFTEQKETTNLRVLQQRPLLEAKPIQKKQLAQIQKIRPQFGIETKELAILYANSKREVRNSEKESRMINYNEYQPPWRRTNEKNPDPTNNIILKPPLMVGTKLKIEMKPLKKDKVIIRVPKFRKQHEYRQYPLTNQKHSKPLRMEYQLLPDVDKAMELNKSSTSGKLEDGNGNKIKIPKSILKGIDHLYETNHNHDAFTFDEAIIGLQKNRHRETITDFEFEIEFDKHNKTREELDQQQHDQKSEKQVPVVGRISKPTRLPLRTQYYPKSSGKPFEIKKSSLIPIQSVLTPITEDENSGLETNFEDNTDSDNKNIKISNKNFKNKSSTLEPIVPNIIRNGEFHNRPNTTNESSTSSDDEHGTEERITTTSRETKNFDETTSDELSESKKLKPHGVMKHRKSQSIGSSTSTSQVADTKKYVTRLPVLTERKKQIKLKKSNVTKPRTSKKPYYRTSKKSKINLSTSFKPSISNPKPNEKNGTEKNLAKAKNLFTSMSYTIVHNNSGNGMIKVYEDGSTAALRQSDMSELKSIIFCSSDVTEDKLSTDLEFNTSKFMKQQSVQTDLLHTGRKQSTDHVGRAVPDLTSSILLEEKLLTKSYLENQRINLQNNAKSDPLKMYTLPVFHENVKTCYTVADMVWNKTPFVLPDNSVIENPLGCHIGEEFLTIFPPPTAYQDDGKAKHDTGFLDVNHNYVTKNITKSLIRPDNYEHYENSERSTYSPSIGLNIINMNYVSSSSSQSLTKPERVYNNVAEQQNRDLGTHKDKRQNMAFQQDPFFYQNQRSYRNNENLSSCPHSNDKHYEPYQCFHQIFEDEFLQPDAMNYSQHPTFNSQIPEGHFLPSIVCPVGRQNHNQQNCQTFFYSTNNSTMEPKNFMESSQQLKAEQMRLSSPPIYSNCFSHLEKCPNCHYNCQHQHENKQQEYWYQKSNQNPHVLPFASVASSVAFTESSFQSRTLAAPQHIHNNNGKVDNQNSFQLPNLKNIDTDEADGKGRPKSSNSNTEDITEDSDESNNGSSNDSGDSSEEESEECSKTPLAGFSRPCRSIIESKLDVNDASESDRAKFKKYLMHLFLKKPSTAIRNLSTSSGAIPHASPPPPTAVSEDSSNASIRVLMSQDDCPAFVALPNCNCLSCRRGLGIRRSLSMSCLDQINYVQKNIKDMKKLKKKIPEIPTKVVDHPKGDRVRPLIQYAGKKGYGQVPEYIKKRKEEIIMEKQIQLEAQLEQTIQKIKMIEDKRKKSRRYWIKKVAEQTREQLEEYYSHRDDNESQSRMSRNITTARRDDIFIGSYHPSNEENMNEKYTNQYDRSSSSSKSSSSSTSSQCDYDKDKNHNITDGVPVFCKSGQVRRHGIRSAHGKLLPFTPQTNMSNSSLYQFKYLLSTSKSLPDTVEYL